MVVSTRYVLVMHVAAFILLSWLRVRCESSESQQQQCRPEEADGTKCQFRPCARGKRLPSCAVGFAVGTTGGAGGPLLTVTDPRDDDPLNPLPGTLRYAVGFAGAAGGGWIVFNRSMTIFLQDTLWIKSNTTMDGRHADVTIVHRGLALYEVQNVILFNSKLTSVGLSDTIHVFVRSRGGWIDHLTSEHGHLGLVTVADGSTDVTVSNCYLKNHYDMLLGASDEDVEDQKLRVTVYRNWFDESAQRMPHCRWGYCHVVNKYYRHWKFYAIGGKMYAKVLSQFNVFEAGNRLEVTSWFDPFSGDMTPTIVSSGDLFLNHARFHQFLHNRTLDEPGKLYTHYPLPTAPTGSLIGLVRACAGSLRGDTVDRCLSNPL